jgi:hypothetical protein
MAQATAMEGVWVRAAHPLWLTAPSTPSMGAVAHALLHGQAIETKQFMVGAALV